MAGVRTFVKNGSPFLQPHRSTSSSLIFDGIDAMRTRDGRLIIVDAGPNTILNALYRARVLQSDDKLEAALMRPDREIGSPPAIHANAGRMNARGISVFYGAND